MEAGISDFKKAIKAEAGKHIYIYEAFLAYLTELGKATQDDNLSRYIEGSLMKLPETAQARGLAQREVISLKEKVLLAIVKVAQAAAANGSDEESNVE